MSVTPTPKGVKLWSRFTPKGSIFGAGSHGRLVEGAKAPLPGQVLPHASVWTPPYNLRQAPEFGSAGLRNAEEIKMKVLRKVGATQQEAVLWSRWLSEAEQIATDFASWEDDPFGYNETAAVGILAAAAIKAGLLALPEYVAKKGDKLDRRKRVNGRCDLWVASSRLSWAFEFKNMILGTPPRDKTLKDRLEMAVKCAKEVTAAEADGRVGCLIVSTCWAELYNHQEALPVTLDKFKIKADFAAVIEPDNKYAAATYFFMKHHHTPQNAEQNLPL